MVAAKLRNSCKGLFERFEILHLPCEYRFSLMKFSVNTKNNFKHFHLHIILIQRINTVFIDQLPAFMFSEKYMLYWHKNIHMSTTLTDRSDERKAQIKAALRRFLNTYSFYSGNEFLMFKKTCNLVQWIWYNIWILCVCVCVWEREREREREKYLQYFCIGLVLVYFVTYGTSCCYFDYILDPWNV